MQNEINCKFSIYKICFFSALSIPCLKRLKTVFNKVKYASCSKLTILDATLSLIKVDFDSELFFPVCDLKI